MASSFVFRQSGWAGQLSSVVWKPFGFDKKHQKNWHWLEGPFSVLLSFQVQQLGIQIWIWWACCAYQNQTWGAFSWVSGSSRWDRTKCIPWCRCWSSAWESQRGVERRIRQGWREPSWWPPWIACGWGECPTWGELWRCRSNSTRSWSCGGWRWGSASSGHRRTFFILSWGCWRHSSSIPIFPELEGPFEVAYVPQTPRASPTTRAHGDDDVDIEEHQAKRSKSDDPKRARIQRIKEAYASHANAVQFGSEKFHTMDSYENARLGTAGWLNWLVGWWRFLALQGCPKRSLAWLQHGTSTWWTTWVGWHACRWGWNFTFVGHEGFDQGGAFSQWSSWLLDNKVCAWLACKGLYFAQRKCDQKMAASQQVGSQRVCLHGAQRWLFQPCYFDSCDESSANGLLATMCWTT